MPNFPSVIMTNERLKRELADAIREILLDFKLSQVDLARRTGLNPAVVCHLVHGNLRYVSLANLIVAFNKLGGAIEMDITSPESLPDPVQAAH